MKPFAFAHARGRASGCAVLVLAALAVTAGAAESERERKSERDRRRTPSYSASAPATTSGANATAPAISPASSFEAFQLIVERNIFNPNRVGRTRAAPEEKAPRVDEISLVGTMQYDGGVMAFFDSPDPAFKKTLKAGEAVADFTVQSIAADGVELLRGDQPLSLKVTQQLRRAEGGDWNVISIVPPLMQADGSGRLESGRLGGSAPPEIPADASEALKRLLEKRQKQLQK